MLRYAHGSGDSPLLGVTVGQLLDIAARRFSAGLLALGLQPGELCTRGYCVIRDYWEDPERTAEAIDAGYSDSVNRPWGLLLTPVALRVLVVMAGTRSLDR